MQRAAQEIEPGWGLGFQVPEDQRAVGVKPQDRAVGELQCRAAFDKGPDGIAGAEPTKAARCLPRPARVAGLDMTLDRDKTSHGCIAGILVRPDVRPEGERSAQ
jgi:hypothetical protein